eukprot:g19988.t1
MGAGRKFERALRRFGRRVWDTPIVCAAIWFLAGCIMLLFMLFSPLCFSTRPCNVSQLAEKMVLTDYPASVVPHGTSISVRCVRGEFVPSHPVLECSDSVLEPIDKLVCTTTQSAAEAARAAMQAQAGAAKENAACQITPESARNCPAVGTLKIRLPNTSRDFCFSYWGVLLDGQCQLNENCIWDRETKTCDSYAPQLIDETVPLGGFVSQAQAIARDSICFMAGPECLEVRGSCQEIDNGEYIRGTSCKAERSYWEKRDETRFIQWDPMRTPQAQACSLGGRWIVLQGSRPLGHEQCDVVARQNSYSTVPIYD